MIEAKELIGKDLGAGVVFTAMKPFPGSVEKVGLRNPEQIPDTILIKYASSYCGVVRIVFISEPKFNENYVYVPTDFVVAEATSEIAETLFEAKRKYEVSNFTNHIGFPGTIGSDPELFVEDEKGVMIPAFEFLPGKDKPALTASGGEFQGYGGKTMYWDGYQAEFTTAAPTCLGYLCNSIAAGLKGVLLAARDKFPKAVLSSATTATIEAERLEKDKPEHVEFGCMPSFNAYGMEGIKGDGRAVNFRSAGGHLHFGISKNRHPQFFEDGLIRGVKALDAILGVMSVSLFAGLEDPRRRTMYGLAGEYRTPAHGLEYRVLSNAWLFHPVLTNLVFDVGRKAYAIGAGDFLKDVWECEESETIRIINQIDVDAAREVLKKNESTMKKIIGVCYGPQQADVIMKLILEGATEHIKNVADIDGNWGLTNNAYRHHCERHGSNIRTASTILREGKKLA